VTSDRRIWQAQTTHRQNIGFPQGPLRPSYLLLAYPILTSQFTGLSHSTRPYCGFCQYYFSED